MKTQMKAGTYYIGDPCYVIGDDKDWLDFLDRMDSARGEAFEYRDETCWVGDTKWGDGVYFDNFDNNYPVDAGLIGVIPMGVVDDHKGSDFGNIAVFKEDFTIEYHDGKFNIGGVEINTEDEDDEDEDDEDEENWI